MEIKALDHSVNIIAMEKNGHAYAMCCAWAMMVDYDKLLCALGSQSVTGNQIQKGDIIGFSSLKKEQKSVAVQLGDRHSDTVDKLAGLDYRTEDGAILINGSLSEISCKVIDVLHLAGIESENVIYLEMIKGKENAGDALHMSDFA